MKIVAFICAFLAMNSVFFAQNYWQQEVNYKIDVKLDDDKHQLIANEEFEYVNNSPDKLEFIYIHLWPNAYSSHKTALGKQLWQNNEQLLRFGGDSIKGAMNGLDFKVNGLAAKLEFDLKNPDIAKLILNEPLVSGARIVVSTPFIVQIPSGEISRLGHLDQSYQITQWYPKPAVYDQNGWNQIPYLNQGEFYSEYGSFDVKITLPKNYVVAATGDLQNQDEIDFLTAKAEKTKKKFSNGIFSGSMEQAETPKSDAELKTLHYIQSNVHDFAWFADKRYEVLKGEVELPHSKRKVTSWAMFTPKNAIVWKEAIQYINDGTYYYSLWNGDYPYNHVTAVDGTISAGGGMEYPNVTVIGNTDTPEELEVVIVHEVGHNWFYGILGSNERVHGWMDEGMNTLNEVRYIQTKYPNNTRMTDMMNGSIFHMDDLNYHDMNDISYVSTAILGEDQAIETHSADFSSMNYGTVMYMKTGLVMTYLKAYLGDSIFDLCARTYFDEWKFKHPQPKNIRSVYERVSGKDLSWLFDDLIQTTNHVDYKLAGVKLKDGKTVVKVKNSGQVAGPVGVSIYKDGKLMETKWSNTLTEKQELVFETDQVDEVRLDFDHSIPEINRRNNQWNASWLFHKQAPLKMEFLIGDHEDNYTNSFWTPVIAGNSYDKFMLGVALHNFGFPVQQWQYLVVPMFSTNRKSLSWLGDVSYSFLPKKGFKSIKLGVNSKSFKDSETYRGDSTNYINLSPYLIFKIGKRNASKISQRLHLQGSYTWHRSGSNYQDEVGAFAFYKWNHTTVDHDLGIQFRNDWIKNLKTSAEMARINVEANYKWRYLKNTAKKERWIEMRWFLGNSYLLKNISGADQLRYGMSLTGQAGLQDIYYENIFFTRNNLIAEGNRLRIDNMGGFKTTSWGGTTTQWMTTFNAFVQVPFLPKGVGFYGDLGWVSINGKMKQASDIGVGIRISDKIGIFAPIYMSNLLGDMKGNYWQKIRFSMRFSAIKEGVNPNKLRL